MQGPVIETERLLLRPQKPEDFEPWAAMMADEETTRFLGGPQPAAVAWRGFCTVAGAWSMFGISMFSVEEKSSGRFIGRLGPWRPHGWPGNEVGWGLARESWGKGYASEGAAAAVDWAFETLGWSDIIHCIDAGNIASQGVARRLGSRHIGPGRMPPPYDGDAVDIWGQTRDAWRARRR